MQAERGRKGNSGTAPLAHRGLATMGVALVCAAAIADVIGALAALPGAWPVFSHTSAAAGAALTCVHLLLAILSRRASRRVIIAGLAGTGILLLAWVLRGHPEIPPDPPLVAAEAASALLLLSQIAFLRGAPDG